jgi:hypothetical protein
VSEWYVIRHERPYDDEDAFVEAEGWALTTKSMVLVGHPDLVIDTQVRCYVTLASGITLVKAEGIVLGYRQPTETRPGGLEVRFKRVGSDTQRLIKRCSERHRRPPPPPSRARKQQYSVLDLELDSPEAGRVSIPDLEQSTPPEPERVSIPEPERVSIPEPERVSIPEPERVSIPEPERRVSLSSERGSLESLRARPLAAVNAPANRADLLERLRKRSS